MNPYLEQEDAWHDFHESFMPLAREILSAQVLPRYFVKIDEHLFIHEPEEESRRFLGRGDVTVAPASTAGGPSSATGVLEAPVHVWLPAPDVERLSYLEIRDRHNRQLITVLELLSPSNKRPGRDRDQYIDKRDQLLVGSANLVEIDLLRGGPRMPMNDLPECDYYALVSRAEERPRAGIWPLRLRDRLPTIPVPLRQGEPDARLDLQAVLHRIYDAAGYAVYIYAGEPEPPLTPEDAAWAQQFLPKPSR
jgi:hypothetical protein